MTNATRQILTLGIARTKASQRASRQLAERVLADPSASPEWRRLAQEVLDPVVVDESHVSGGDSDCDAA